MGLPGGLAAEWLEPAILHAAPGELPELAVAAVPAGPRAMAAIIGRLGDLDETALRVVTGVLRAASGLPEAVGRAMGEGLDRDAATRLAGILEGVRSATTAWPLAMLAIEPDAGGEAASVALRRWMDRGGDRRIGPDALEATIRAWAATRRPDLLVAIAMATGRLRGGAAVLETAEDGSGGVADPGERDPALRIALGSILQRSGRGPLIAAVAPRLLSWLATEPVSRSVQRALGEARSADDAMAIFAGGHVLDLPATRRGLAGVSRPARGLPSDAHLQAFTPRAARGLLRYVARVPLTPAIRGRTLTALSTHADPVTTWRATHRLTSDSIRRVGGQLARLAMDAPAPAARVAVRRLRNAGGGEALDRRLADRAGDAMSRVARRRTPDHPERRTAGRTAAWRRAVALAELAADRDAVLTDWRSALIGGDASQRQRVILAVTRLGMVRPLADAIGACAVSEDPRVAAVACAALRWARDEPSRDRLRRAAGEHADPRVRANALESLARRGDADLGLITRAAGSDTARERSMAALALARLDPVRAGRLAGAMLLDARPEHRISGTWTARRLGEPHLVPILVEVVRRDPSPVIRRRARSVLAAMVRGDRPEATVDHERAPAPRRRATEPAA